MAMIRMEESPICIHCLKRIDGCNCKLGGFPGMLRAEVKQNHRNPQVSLSNSSDLLGCEWRYDSYNDQMVTGCKDSWPGYKSVEMKFCFNCGKKIKHVSNVAI